MAAVGAIDAAVALVEAEDEEDIAESPALPRGEIRPTVVAYDALDADCGDMLSTGDPMEPVDVYEETDEDCGYWYGRMLSGDNCNVTIQNKRPC